MDRALEKFGLGSTVSEPEPAKEAWSNQVVRVTTESGAYALKLFDPDLGGDDLVALRESIEVEETVFGTGAVPMPAQVVDPSTGRWLVEIAPSCSGPSRLARAHVWVDGEVCADAPPSVASIRDVGRSVAALHRLALPGGDTSGLRAVDLDRWYGAVAQARETDSAWSADLEACSPLVEELSTRVEQLRAQKRPMCTSHRDLNPKNAVVRPDGRVALTDWDHAGPVLPGVELVVAASSFAGVSPEVDEELVTEFVAAYRDAGGDAEAPDPVDLAVECADIDWLLRNVERSLREAQHDDELHQRLAPALVGSFAAQVTSMERWARLMADL